MFDYGAINKRLSHYSRQGHGSGTGAGTTGIADCALAVVELFR
ncbi:hypothetical protein [Sulfurisoma sediminicola]|nr:hypothetical protein [Sulfurisoma sediminicola]